MYAKLLLSSKTIAWHLSAEQHLGMFRCETPAKACGCARSAWAGQPQPCLRVNCKPPGRCWLLERAAPANSTSMKGKGQCKGQNYTGQSPMACPSFLRKPNLP